MLILSSFSYQLYFVSTYPHLSGSLNITFITFFRSLTFGIRRKVCRRPYRDPIRKTTQRMSLCHTLPQSADQGRQFETSLAVITDQ